MIRVTIWNEHSKQETPAGVLAVYPGGMNEALADAFAGDNEIQVRLASLDDADMGLSDEIIDNTDVMLWWGHSRHEQVPDELASKVRDAVVKGMGFIPLHSAHYSKPFRWLMGTSCDLKWRDGVRERLWCCDPGHAIAQGIPEHFELEIEEMYGEFFNIPQPEHLVFIGWFAGGEVFRSGCTFTRGLGKIFYFQPGHETNPTYHNENIKKILRNAVHWAAPTARFEKLDSPHTEALEK